MTRPWSGIQHLTRPIPSNDIGGMLIDTFYRRGLDTWVVWALLPVEDDGMHHRVILLGAFRDRAQARFAADTAQVACRQDLHYMPMMHELLQEGEHGGDAMDVLHAVSHFADSAAWLCEHRVRTSVLSRLCGSDLERLTHQIENRRDIVQDWRFVWVGVQGQLPVPTLIRMRGKKPAAAFVLTHDTFDDEMVSVWLNGVSHDLPCKVVDISSNVLSSRVLDNLAAIMGFCDEELARTHGADTNAPEFIALLREENYRASARQMSQAFGTGNFVGVA
jgi:hypothetical protein